jgi:hypothetical protein
METKNSDSKITSLMGSTTVHVIGEVVALGGVLYYVSSQTSQLNAKITSLEQKVANLTDILRNIVPGAFSPTPEDLPSRLERAAPHKWEQPTTAVVSGKHEPSPIHIGQPKMVDVGGSSKENFVPPAQNVGKWEYLKPSEINDDNCKDGVCQLPSSMAGRRNKQKEEKNVTFNGSVEQLKYGDDDKSPHIQKSTKMMVASPSMRHMVPESVDEEDEETDIQPGFSGIRKVHDSEISENEINQIVSKAIRPAKSLRRSE